MRRSSGTRIILTGAEHFGGLAAARALRAARHEVWAAVVDNRGYAAFSRLTAGKFGVPDPSLRPVAFVEVLAAAAERVGAEIVLPGNDVALLALSSARGSFPAGTSVGVCTRRLVERATSKALLGTLAQTAGFAVPTTEILDVAGVPHARVDFPAVVKPVRSDVEAADGTLIHGGAVRVENPEAFRRAIETLGGDAWLVQPYLRGELVAVGGLAWNGAVTAQVHQVAHRIWPPDCGGSSYGSTIPLDGERAEKVARLVGDLGWSGIFQVQVVRHGDTEFLIDVNPRLYGTLELALRAGVNLPALWVDLLRGEEPGPSPAYRVGVHFRAAWKDARALRTAAAGGHWGEACRGSLPRRRTAHPVFSWRDPLPVLAGAVRVAGKARTAVPVPGRPAPASVDKSAKTS